MRIRNWSIRAKIILLVVPPLASLLALWIFATVVLLGPALDLLDGLSVRVVSMPSWELFAAQSDEYRERVLPADVPSLSVAAALPEIDESATWIGLLAPAGTPAAVVDKLQAEVARIYADPAIQERLQKAGLFPVNSTPASGTWMT